MIRIDFVKRVAVCAVIIAAIFPFGGCTLNVNQPNSANNANAQKSPVSAPAATPAPRRVAVFDEEFSLRAGASREVKFTVPKGDRATRLEGGLRVKGDDRIDLYIYPAADYSASADKSKKAINLIQIKNERIEERLEAGDYVMVLENLSADTAEVAAEFDLVDN